VKTMDVVHRLAAPPATLLASGAAQAI